MKPFCNMNVYQDKRFLSPKKRTGIRSCFEFLQKVFLGLMYPLRQIARYLPHHRSENASKTHPKSAHDKFKTAFYCFLCMSAIRQSVRMKNAVVLPLPMKYISRGG